MNKEYIYLDGKVIVEDEKDNKKLVEYSDNLEEILIQENLIEEMENRIKELEKDLENNKENNKPYIPFLVPTVILTFILARTVMAPLLGLDVMVDTIFGTMNNSTLTIGVVAAFTLPVTISAEMFLYKQDKHNKRSRRADVAEYEFLKKQVVIQKQKLEELKQDKTKTTEISEFKVEKVDDLETLNALKSWLVLYSNLGYNMDEYYKLYQDDKLEEHLKSKGYTEEACECAKEFVSEKAPTLVKRK